MFYDDDRVKAAAERCARLEAWQKSETDPAKREEIGRALSDARDTFKAESERATKEKAEREAAAGAKEKDGKMFGDGNVTDFLKNLDKANAEKQVQAEQKAQASEEAKPEAPKEAEVDAAVSAELERLRELEPPREITELPEYKEAYAEAMDKYTAEAEAAVAEITAADRPVEQENFAELATPNMASASEPHEAELQPGSEISADVQAIERRGDTMVYIVRDDEGFVSELHDDAKNPQFPDIDVGDSIHASRDQDGEYQISHDNDYGM